MRPPKCSTMRRLIGSPRPVPRGRFERVAALAELLEHELLLLDRNARPVVLDLDTPPSRRRRAAGCARARARAARISPHSTAGSSSTWSSRSGSTCSGGTCSGISSSTVAPRSRNISAVVCTACVRSARRSTAAERHSAWPASILARSSTWLTRRVRRSVSATTRPRKRCALRQRPSPGRRPSARRRRGSRSAACAARASPTT